jgi:hypothetical protein
VGYFTTLLVVKLYSAEWWMIGDLRIGHTFRGRGRGLIEVKFDTILDKLGQNGRWCLEQSNSRIRVESITATPTRSVIFRRPASIFSQLLDNSKMRYVLPKRQ